MSHRDRSPVKTLSTRCPLGQDHKNQMSPLYNLTLLQPGIELLVSSGQRRTGPPTESVSLKFFFSPFLSPMGVLVPCHQGSEPVQGTKTKTGNEQNFDWNRTGNRNEIKFYSSEQNRKFEN